MKKITSAIFCSLISFSPLLFAEIITENVKTSNIETSENPNLSEHQETKTYVQKPIIIENSSAVMSVPLKPTTPVSAATPLKAVISRSAMNIKTVFKEKIFNAKVPLAPIMIKYNHLLPMPIGAQSQKPILDAPIITENSNAEKNQPIKTVSSQIFSDIPIIIECSYSLINTPINEETEKLKKNPPFIQKMYLSDYFPDTLYVLNIPTKAPLTYQTPVSCVPVSFHQDWCCRYPGQCEKNLETRKKMHENWCKKHPLECQQEKQELKNMI